jgi:hypothetical protein
MKGIVLPGDGEAYVKEWDWNDQTVGPNEVRVDIGAAALCRSDMSLYYGDPLVGGDPGKGAGPTRVDPETTDAEEHDTVDNQGNPLEVELPQEVGALTLDGSTESVDVADLVHSFRDPDITEEQMLENARKCARYYNFYLPDYMFHQYNWGYWGNVRDFEFPPKGHQIYHVRSENEEEYPVLAGVPQTKFDTDYQPP